MTIRVLEEGWRNQYERMQRSRARLASPYQSSVAYDDDFYHAVQDAWHLKDWIAGDGALGSTLGKAVAMEAESTRELRIVADLANCTKHLVLTKNIREGAAMQSTNSTINMQDGRMIREIVVRLKDGSSHSGVTLLDEAQRAWESLLTRHGLL